jgi:hypothetical protein
VAAMPRSYQVTPVGPDQPLTGTTHANQPEDGTHPKSQATSGQEPNHHEKRQHHPDTDATLTT